MNNIFSKFKLKINIKTLFTVEKTTNLKKLIKQFSMRLSANDKIIFIKQLSILVKSGVPLSSLNMIKNQNRSKTTIKILENVIRDVENGQYLATALGKFKKTFGDLAINVISVGEISGSLGDNLDYLALTLRKQQSLKRKIVSASICPIFIVITTLLITIMLTVFFFPKVVPVLKSVNYQLPWTTKLLIFFSDAMKHQGLLIASSIFISIIGIFLLLRIKKIHFWYDHLLLFVPFANNFIKTYNAANICRNLGLLQNSGFSVVRAFHITSNTTSNLVYKKELSRIADQLLKGEKISFQIKNNKKLFPPIMMQMIAVGESTGKLSETFLYLSKIYEEEMDDITKDLSTVAEPLLLVFMGVLVGFIAISIISPIYGITQHLRAR